MRYEKELFGDLRRYHLWSDVEASDVNVGDRVTIVNSNCEFTYDNIKCCFEENLLSCYVCDLELLSSNLTEYQREKSINGGAYAYATCIIKKIHKIEY